MADETSTESVATEPVVESAPVSEPVIETVPPSEPITEPQITEPILTAQRVEPLNPEPIAESQPTSEPVPQPSTPTPQPSLEATAGTAEPSTAPVEPSPVPESVQLSPTPTESQLEPAVQRAEPVSNGTSQAPEITSESAPAPQPQVSTPPVIQTSLARELLIKAREAIQFRKRKKLEKIMGMFLKQASITNDDVEKLLHVSDATATRYLDQLEREGKIKKENAGKYSSYSRI